jgi:hypothetical protein
MSPDPRGERVQRKDFVCRGGGLVVSLEAFLTLSDHGTPELCDIQTAFHAIHERSIPRFSHLAAIRASCILMQPDELRDFDIISHVCTGSLDDVCKVRSKTDGRMPIDGDAHGKKPRTKANKRQSNTTASSRTGSKHWSGPSWWLHTESAVTSLHPKQWNFNHPREDLLSNIRLGECGTSTSYHRDL